MAKILRGGSIYLHIPKTGGNWLTQLLEDHRLITGEIGHKHATYDVVCGLLQSRRGLRLRRLFARGLARYRFLAVVRHPLRWYESWFKYQVSKEFRDWGRSGDPIAWHVMSSINGVDDREFNAFVRSIHRRDPGFVTKLYAKYVSNADAIVLRNEHLREDLVAAGDRLGLGIPAEAIRAAPELGVSPRLAITWERAVLDQTVRLEAAALAQFGYAAEGVVQVA